MPRARARCFSRRKGNQRMPNLHSPLRNKDRRDLPSFQDDCSDFAPFKEPKIPQGRKSESLSRYTLLSDLPEKTLENSPLARAPDSAAGRPCARIGSCISSAHRLSSYKRGKPFFVQPQRCFHRYHIRIYTLLRKSQKHFMQNANWQRNFFVSHLP